MTLTSLASLLVGWTLTVSPVSTTHHFQDEMLPTARPVFGNNPTTWHPGAHFLATSKHLQASAFFMRDTYDYNAYGLVAGPKLDLFNGNFSLGAVAGIYVRKQQFQKFPLAYKKFGHEFVPLAAMTASVNIPISDRMDFSINSAWNPLLINTTLGIRFKF